MFLRPDHLWLWIVPWVSFWIGLTMESRSAVKLNWTWDLKDLSLLQLRHLIHSTSASAVRIIFTSLESIFKCFTGGHVFINNCTCFGYFIRRNFNISHLLAFGPQQINPRLTLQSFRSLSQWSEVIKSYLFVRLMGTRLQLSNGVTPQPRRLYGQMARSWWTKRASTTALLKTVLTLTCVWFEWF